MAWIEIPKKDSARRSTKTQKIVLNIDIDSIIHSPSLVITAIRDFYKYESGLRYASSFATGIGAFAQRVPETFLNVP